MRKIDRESRMGMTVLAILCEVEMYGTQYAAVFGGSKVGDDAVLGDDGVRDILKGCRVLLNGPLGHHDGGTLDRRILDVAARLGLLDDNGEL